MFYALSKVDSGRILVRALLAFSPSSYHCNLFSTSSSIVAKMSSGAQVQPSSSSTSGAPRDLQDYTRFLNEHSVKRQPSLIRELSKLTNNLLKYNCNHFKYLIIPLTNYLEEMSIFFFKCYHCWIGKIKNVCRHRVCIPHPETAEQCKQGCLFLRPAWFVVQFFHDTTWLEAHDYAHARLLHLHY